ncbi:hypothetical protein T4E_2021 [Trichinella pseudospiralis]|uniref:Uncharacterized protein n=1 Tax=Trichinella pseudospiralis TaxID=6337 RepID=A0A0V0YLY1_TRIPS|nr:hypothetical protein T4E_2021 [Trichinella pseudospiralis]
MYFHGYLNVTSIPRFESFQHTHTHTHTHTGKYRVPIIFSREQIIGQLPIISSLRRGFARSQLLSVRYV